MLTIGNKKFET